MPDPAVPESLMTRISDLERRLRALERSPQLTSSSIRDGTLSILDGDGTTTVEVGDSTVLGMTVRNPDTGIESLTAGYDPSTTGSAVITYDTAGNYTTRLGKAASDADAGIIISTDGDNMGNYSLYANGGGLIRPAVPIVWWDPNVVKAATTGTFDSKWRCLVRFNPSKQIYITVRNVTDVGTTGEMRIINVTTGLQWGSTMTMNTGGVVFGSVFYADMSDIDVGVNDTFQLSIEARRASGAGNVWLYTPTGVHTDLGVVPSGNWV